mmetsp:Transcript_58414/g.169425  ORF Transcript_58414/g.169425 Transcript_58414/m.169425 type:complete len:230 (+) Transcript_58414:217-906(+)
MRHGLRHALGRRPRRRARQAEPGLGGEVLRHPEKGHARVGDAPSTHSEDRKETPGAAGERQEPEIGLHGVREPYRQAPARAGRGAGGPPAAQPLREPGVAGGAPRRRGRPTAPRRRGHRPGLAQRRRRRLFDGRRRRRSHSLRWRRFRRRKPDGQQQQRRPLRRRRGRWLRRARLRRRRRCERLQRRRRGQNQRSGDELRLRHVAHAGALAARGHAPDPGGHRHGLHGQ